MRDRIPSVVVHHGRFDPRERRGGVETFARTLGDLFEEVVFSTPGSPVMQQAARERWPVVCDNATVLDWPVDVPVFGFQHGYAIEKARITRTLTDARLAIGQIRAARRPNTRWVACAGWIRDAFGRFPGNRAERVIWHPVDLDRFDGELRNRGSRLILHDARSPHKGSDLVARIARHFPSWRFEPLACAPEAVPDRMRAAAGFLHLSRYEGNSIVCNEAMAMNLPCLFSRVGLMRDGEPLDVHTIDLDRARKDPLYLLAETQAFLSSLDTRTFRPRQWLEQHATPAHARDAWRELLGPRAV